MVFMALARRRTAPLMANEARRSLWSSIYRQRLSDYSIMHSVEDYSVRFVVSSVGEVEREPRLRGEIRAGSGSNWQLFHSSCILRSGIPSTVWGKCFIRGYLSYSGSVSRISVSIVFCSVYRFSSGSLGALRHNSGFRTVSLKVTVTVCTMKRPGKRSRSGERPGSSKRPSARPQSTPLLTTIKLTSSPKDPPASNPTRHPIPNSAFQSTHFKFQSNLNRPLISAQITILMTEEINQVPPISCIDPNSSNSSERSSAQFAMAAKKDVEPVI